MLCRRGTAVWTARRLQPVVSRECHPVRLMSSGAASRVEGVLRFQCSSPQLGHAIALCAEEAERRLSSVKDYVSLIVIYPPKAEWQEELEEQEVILPEGLRKNSLTIVSRTFSDKNARGFHVSINVLKLEDGGVLEMFTAEQDGLPHLDCYRELLASDRPPPLFLLALTENAKRRELFKKLEMLFPESSKFMCQVHGSRVLLNGVANKLCVGLVLQSKAHGDQMKALIMELLGELRLIDLKLDRLTAQRLFLPQSPIAPLSTPTARLGFEKQLGESGSQEYIREGMVKSPFPGEEDFAPIFPLQWASPIIPGLDFDFVVFEPRYRLMVKMCVDHGALFVLTKPGEKVGTACRVIRQSHGVEKDGTSDIRVIGVARVRVQDVHLSSSSFGLQFARCEVFEDEPIVGDDRDTAEMMKIGMLGVLEDLLRQIKIDLDINQTMSRFSKFDPYQLSIMLITALSASTVTKYRWLEMTNSLERMRMQMLVMREMIVRASELE